MKTTLTSLVLILAAASANATPTVQVDTTIGAVVAAEGNNMTLYTFRNDQRGRSNCTGSCVASWPPFLVGGAASANDGSTVIARPDGTQQWADSNEMPLYFWAGDSAPGQTSGDGGVWDAARR